MLYLYAQINEDGVCVGVSQLSGIVESDDMIPLTEEDFAMGLIGRKYENGRWGDQVIDEPVDPPDSELLKLWAAIDEQAEALGIILGVTDNEYA